MSFGNYSQGRTVYGSGSYAPTRGPVSPAGAQGYLKREMRKGGNVGLFGGVSRLGRDGQSDTRSGMAAAAMQRQDRWAGKEGGPGFNPNSTHKGGKTGITPAQTRPHTIAPPITPQQTQPVTPTVTVNAAGTLELPYNQQYSEDVLAGLADTNQALLALQQQQQQQALAYAEQQRQEGINYTNQQRGTLNDNAARGVAFSSGYGVAVGNDANNHNNMLNQLAQDNANKNAEFEFNRTTIMNAFKDSLRQAAQQYGNELNDDAGSLGYGSVNSGQGQAVGPRTNPWAGVGTQWHPPKMNIPKHPKKPKKGK